MPLSTSPGGYDDRIEVYMSQKVGRWKHGPSSYVIHPSQIHEIALEDVFYCLPGDLVTQGAVRMIRRAAMASLTEVEQSSFFGSTLQEELN